MFTLKFEKLVYGMLFCLAFVFAACAAPITPGSSSQGTQMTLFVDAQQADCVGIVPQKCLLTKTDPNGEWEFFYDSIEGFNFEEGYVYELLVETFEVENPPADGSSIRYELVEIVSKEAVNVENTGTDVYVEGIEIEIMESFPVQAAAVVRGHLADGCVVLDGISAERNGSTFGLTAESHKEGDVCTLALVPFEQVVPLDVVGLKAGTYSVVLGEASAEFTLDIDNGEKEEAVKNDTVITLERTACFGTCPIYTITIYGDGRVVYDGEDLLM